MKKSPTLSLGKKGEQIACWHLKKKGWNIAYKNFRVPHGEIDIVAYDHLELVMIEVKTRRQQTDLRTSMSYEKSRKILRNWHYLVYILRTTCIRIDVMYLHLRTTTCHITHLHHALTETDYHHEISF